MDVNYGRAVKTLSVGARDSAAYSSNSTRLTCSSQTPLVSSAIVCFRNSPPPAGHEIKFTFGGKA
jgi:hypothetical protein